MADSIPADDEVALKAVTDQHMARIDQTLEMAVEDITALLARYGDPVGAVSVLANKFIGAFHCTGVEQMFAAQMLAGAVLRLAQQKTSVSPPPEPANIGALPGPSVARVQVDQVAKNAEQPAPEGYRWRLMYRGSTRSAGEDTLIPVRGDGDQLDDLWDLLRRLYRDEYERDRDGHAERPVWCYQQQFESVFGLPLLDQPPEDVPDLEHWTADHVGNRQLHT